jgi:anti-sigma factor RsiW
VSASEREPTPEELRAMAYVDGELSADERREFEELLARRADLQREVARLQRLNILARSAAGPEPLDHEWRKLEREPVGRASWSLGLSLLAGGVNLFVAVALYLLWTSDAHIALQLAATFIVSGGAMLLGWTLYARLRTRHLDPYTDIER